MAFGQAAHRDLATVHHQPRLIVRAGRGERLPAAGQPRVGLRVERTAVDRRLRQRAQAIVGGAVHVQHVAVRLDLRDRRQEALALQAVLEQPGGLDVGRRHQGHALGEEALEQAPEQHRIADVVDEELIQHQDAQVAAPLPGDGPERIGFALVIAQPGVDLAHETVEVGAPLPGDRQAVEEQIDQEGLAAADAPPQVKPGRGRGGLAAQGIQPALPGRRHEGGMEAVELDQHAALGGIVVPLAAGHALGVATRRRQGGRRVGHRLLNHWAVRSRRAGRDGCRS